MMQNKDLFNNLNDQLDKLIKNKLKNNSKMTCEKEVMLIRSCLNEVSNTATIASQEDIILDVAYTLNHLLDKIDKEIAAIETECGGVMNYSLYINERLKQLKSKLELRKTIKTMLRRIYEEYPEVKAAI